MTTVIPPEQHRLRITTPCPACGSPSLFIGSGGGLTCAVLSCPEPSVEAALADTSHRVGRIILSLLQDDVLAAKREAKAFRIEIDTEGPFAFVKRTR